MKKFLILFFVIFSFSEDLLSQELISHQKYHFQEGENKLRSYEAFRIREIFANDAYGVNDVIVNFDYIQGKWNLYDIDSIFPFFIRLNLLENKIEWRKAIKGEYHLHQRLIYPSDNDFTILCKTCTHANHLGAVFKDCYPTIFRMDTKGEIFSYKFDTNTIKTGQYDSQFQLINDKIHFTSAGITPIRHIIDTSTFQIVQSDIMFEENKSSMLGLSNEIHLTDSTSLMSMFRSFVDFNHGLFVFNYNSKSLKKMELEYKYSLLIDKYKILNDKIFIALEYDMNRFLYFDKEQNTFTKEYEFFEDGKRLWLSDIFYVNENILGFVAYNYLAADNNMIIFSDYDGNELARINNFTEYSWAAYSAVCYNSNYLYIAYQYFEDHDDSKFHKDRYSLRDTFFVSKYLLDLDKLLSINHNNENNNAFSIFPNPAGDFINISIDIEVNLLTREVQIFDLLGLVVSKQELTDGNNRIDISDLPRGTYFIKVGDKVEKFVKM